MRTTIKPVFYSINETPGFLNYLEDDIKEKLGKDSDLILDYPVIYLHVWQNKKDSINGKFNVYIGETNDIIARTKEHWAAARIDANRRKAGNWQYKMLHDVDQDNNQVIPTLYIIGHKLFNKSLTLDIENRLIDFCFAMQTANTNNGRTNAQGNYSNVDVLDDIFSMIWRQLKKVNNKLFLSECTIRKSAIYKSSPNHRLTQSQKGAKQLIIDRTIEAILNDQRGQLVFVEGEAGTGKTVLTSSTFYSLMENELLKKLNAKCLMLINHEEQYNLYKNMSRKLGYDESIVQNPTSFLRTHSILNENSNLYEPDLDNIADIVFVDEAHLLWNQTNRAFDKKFKLPQLDEIMKRSRVTVIMFDENQILHKGQIYCMDYMTKKRNLAKSQGPNPSKDLNNYIVLKDQLRMNCDFSTMEWIDSFTKDLTIKNIRLNARSKDTKGYEIKFFDSPSELHNAIKRKAKKKETQLSRVVATCDWDFNNTKKANSSDKYWRVKIGNFILPWNEQIFHVDIEPKLNNRQKKMYSSLDWAEKDYSINEVGSTFTIQGFDLAYAGVIIGPSVRYDKNSNKIWFDESKRARDDMKGNRTLRDGSVKNITNIISKHELRVLLSRGTKGLYVYACDCDLRIALKNSIE